MQRPVVGILQRKTSTSGGSERHNFSSLSLLPHELNRSLTAGIDDVETENYDNHSRSSSIDSGVQGGTKIILQTQPRRGSVTHDSDSAVLVYNTSYGGKMKFTLNKPETSIGRKEDNDISLSCAKISKRHASILRKEDRYAYFAWTTLQEALFI
jgi:hypothetical protein